MDYRYTPEEIGQLNAEIDQLRAALRDLVAHDTAMIAVGIMRPFVELERANKALNGEQSKDQSNG